MKIVRVGSSETWLLIGLLVTVSAGCAGDAVPPQPSGPYSYGGYPRPYYQEIGPWDLPSGPYPGPPTWYGCPQQSLSCFPD
jgi:hypothetical protein